jgi:hypothetical protein
MKHSAQTHRIPLPPDSFRRVSDHVEIFSNIKSFVKGEDDETRLPPLCARLGDIEAVESVLRLLQDGSVARKDAGRDIIRVYSASRLFHELRNKSMFISREEIVHPNFLDKRQLIDDSLPLALGISCDFHETGAMEYCSLSYVHVWT